MVTIHKWVSDRVDVCRRNVARERNMRKRWSAAPRSGRLRGMWSSRLALAALALVALLLATAPTALAAAPAATTTGADRISPSGARLLGQVDPNGEATTYVFEYGTTQRLGSRTPDARAGAGAAPRNVAAPVSGLRPATRYFFRVVASNRSGVRSGVIRAFTTRPQPLGLQIAATPNPVTFNFASTITGRLTGTNSGGRPVQLQSRPFPYTGAFTNLGNAVVTRPDGTFAVPLPVVGATAQYRALVTNQPGVVSPILTLAVAVRVKTNVSTTRPRRGSLVRFSGTIRPARPGALYAIQKQNSAGGWSTVAGSITRSGGQTYSGFSKRLRIRRSGSYRVFVSIVDGNLVSGIGRTIAIRPR